VFVVGSERYRTLIWIDGSASLGRVWGRVRERRKKAHIDNIVDDMAATKS